MFFVYKYLNIWIYKMYELKKKSTNECPIYLWLLSQTNILMYEYICQQIFKYI